MMRTQARSEANKLARVMEALNAPVTDGRDPLVGIFAIRAGARMVMPKLRPDDAGKWKAALLAHGAHGARAWEELLRATSLLQKQVRGDLFPPLRKHSRDKFRPQGSSYREAVASRQFWSLLRSATRFREWVEACALGKGGRLLRELERRSLSATDRIAFGHLRKIARLGVYRCRYAKCGKLTLNTSGHASRKYCTGTNCARNDSQARIMAERFAKLQAEKIHRAKAAIAIWPGNCNPRNWIATHAKVTKRWVTEAERRGDIRAPDERMTKRRKSV